MNLLDWVFIIIIVASSIYGLFKGFIKEVISVLAVIIGLILASRLYETTSPLIERMVSNHQVSNILSFFILFIIISYTIVLIGRVIHKFVQAIFLGWLNRLGGVGFGFMRGVIVSSIIIMVLTITLSERAPILTQSKLSPYINGVSKVLLTLVPQDLRDRSKEKLQRLQGFWKGKFNVDIT